MTEPAAPPPQPPHAPDGGAASAATPADLAEVEAAQPAPAPQIVRKNRLRLSLVWLVPLLALFVGLGLVARQVLETGPDIVIELRSGDGLEAGRTEVRYKEVAVGRVTRVRLSQDRQRVLVDVRLDKAAAGIAVQDTRFWVVRPRVSTGGISGLGTLLSGAYIGVDAGVSSERLRHFVGLDAEPFVLRSEGGRSFVLQAADLGSLDVGSPVYYRRLRVGRVIGFALDPDSDTMQVQVFVESPHDRLVSNQTRFWNASGLDFSLDASGLRLSTQSLAALVGGGVAFGTPPEARGPFTPAEDGRTFTLFADAQLALAPPQGRPVEVRMVFEQSTRGLAVGAPVDVLGVEVGKVRSLTLEHDPRRQSFRVEATAELYPLRLGLHNEPASGDRPGDAERRTLKALVEHGLRAQLRTGNLFTGQLYVALDFPDPAPARASLDLAAAVPTLPAVPSLLGELQPQLANLLRRVSAVKFDRIGESLLNTLESANQAIAQLTPEARLALSDVRRTLEHAQRTLEQVQRTLDGATQTLHSADASMRALGSAVAPQAPLQRSARLTLEELQRTAKALRQLADYLQQHPESLLRGKPADPALPSAPRSPSQ